MRILLFLSFLVLIKSIVVAQPFQQLDAKGFVNGVELLNPWSGGFNKPQFSQADLDQDGIMDMYVFDNAADISLCFKGYWEGGVKRYKYQLSLCNGFPSISEYALLRDFNGDGIPDLFCSHPVISGVRVFKGQWDGNALTFDQMRWGDQQGLAVDALWYYRKNSQTKVPQLYVASTDIPGVYDVDGDGDLDILTFDLVGFTMHFYKNMSMERGFGVDSLLFMQQETCWGGFYESGITPAVELSTTKGQCFSNITMGELDGFRHAGSTVLAFDANADGLTDLLLGDISFSQLVLLINGGAPDTAWIVDQDDRFPFYDTPLDILSFPAAFEVDVDDDGLKDIVVGPNSGGFHEDLDNIWYYRQELNQGQQEYTLIQRDFLQDESFDFGSGAYPVFFDHNGDGLLDMVVGLTNRYQKGKPYHSSLFLLENRGTLSAPEFHLVDSNYLEMAQLCDPEGLNLCAFMPHFADMDGDGDLDFLCMDGIGTLFYRENTALAGDAPSFGPLQYEWQGIVAGAEGVPHVADIDEDGLPDLLVGLRAGRTMFYKNTGTKSAPYFNFDQNAPENIRVLGGINSKGISCLTGAACPAVVYEKGERKVVMGSDCNGLKVYKINENDFRSTYPLENGHAIEAIREGRYQKMSFADLDGDGFLEMAVGNIRGGISLFGTIFRMDDSLISSMADQFHKENTFRQYPNPVSESITIEWDQDFGNYVSFSLYDLMGREVAKTNAARSPFNWPVHNLSGGCYLLKIAYQGGVEVHKIMKESRR
jgi:hypothetical protein